MSLAFDATLILDLKHTDFEKFHRNVSRWQDSLDNHKIDIEFSMLSNEALEELIVTVEKQPRATHITALKSLLEARAGIFDRKANFGTLKALMISYLAQDLIDGWIYQREADGKLYPYLITNITYEADKFDGKNRNLQIKAVAYGLPARLDREQNGDEAVIAGKNLIINFSSDISKNKISTLLESKGLYKETATLKAEYQASMDRYYAEVANAHKQQFRFSGLIYATSTYRLENRERKNRRVIQTVGPSQYAALKLKPSNFAWLKNPDNTSIDDAHIPIEDTIPEHPITRVFDLQTHVYYGVHADYLEPYQYDLSLREKLILPDTHRDLLDILTTDLSLFTADIIEGKNAGNVILCKGISGVGKTLTAEVYAELTKKALFFIKTGTLGTDPERIEANLRKIFDFAKAYDCVLLLDEADIFVAQRGNSIEQNAIVAIFLRALEYFDGLLFLTTNRSEDIDEAIVSRCAAIILYELPTPHRAKQIWKVQANNFEVTLKDSLLDELVEIFPSIAPRDIKMLLRLTLRMANHTNADLTIDLFRQCAMFRAIHMGKQ